MKLPYLLAGVYYRYLSFFLCFFGILLSLWAIDVDAQEVGTVETVIEPVKTEELLNTYALGYGDTVSIKVYGEDDLTVETQLNDLGVISFPFLGELYVLGLTVTELQEKIAQGLEDGYLVDPKVSVVVTQYRQFFVNGEVRQPGGFVFLPGLTVRKAISLAGGFTARAATGKIFIISDGEDTKPRKVDLSTSISPGDVITVRQRFF